MSWLNKIKKIFREEKKIVEDECIETVSLDKLPYKIEEKIKEQEIRGELVKKEIISRIERFEADMTAAIEVLEKVDLTKRKDYERIKLVVTENLNLYISHLKRLIANIQKTEKLNAEETLDRASFYFNEFNKNSFAPFEKATILVGKELEAVKEILIGFVRDFNKISKDNKTSFEEVKNRERLSSLISDLNKYEDYVLELDKKISDFNRKLDEEKEKFEAMKNKIINIKNSEDYKHNLKEKEEYREKLANLEKEIELVKQKTDLKLLSRRFHNDKKRNNLIKEYGHDFKSALINDENLIILDLLKEAGDLEISEFGKLREKILEFNEPLITEFDKNLVEFENELDHIRGGMKHLEDNIIYDTNKKERLTSKKERTLFEINVAFDKLFSNLKLDLSNA